MKAWLAALALVAAAPDAPLVALRWTGTATVATPNGPLRLGVRTRVSPTGSATGESWRLSDPQHEVRVLHILPDRGWMERGAERVTLPDALVRHERQQYALYGQMQRALRGAKALVRRGVRQVTIPASDPGGVATRFTLDAAGRLTGGRNTVSDPQDAARRIDQVFRFADAQPLGDLRWPHRIEIWQDGRPYFTLLIDTIAVDAAG